MNAQDYESFLASKKPRATDMGIDVPEHVLNAHLYDFQRYAVRWALRKGRCALFGDTGLGKTITQVAWADAMGERTLLIAPLVVAQQTVREAARHDITVHYARHGSDVGREQRLIITNYEMVDHFDPDDFGAVVLDESSRLKHVESKTRTKLTQMFADTRYRLCCTATPAPNDVAELANHAEFLGIMSRTDMLATYFVHDDMGWRLKGHAREPFYRWLATWALSYKKPSDLGYSDDAFSLPPLSIVPEFIPNPHAPDGQLFAIGLSGVPDRARVRRQSLSLRVSRAAALISSEPDQAWIAWVGLNTEEEALAALVPDAAVVSGSMTPDAKSVALSSFLDGHKRVLITKPSVAGFGLNLQHCARQIFVGLSDSQEAFYQCIRRSWRYGQREPVLAHVILTDTEEEIYHNVRRKEEQAEMVSKELVRYAAEFATDGAHDDHEQFTYATGEQSGASWRLLLGDNVERIAEIETGSVGLSVFSPPFLDLFTYSATEHDMGNCRTPEEFWMHFNYLIPELLRVTMPGRLCCVHVAQVASMLVRDGVIGLKDFRGDTIKAFTAAGWIHHGEACISKNPQAQAIRTHSKALLFTQLRKDSTWSRPALMDFVLIFRAPGENTQPVYPDITNDEWIAWADGAWLDIRETNTLNVAEGRTEEDERHICPLQLDTIERCVRLWSNRGDTVFDPFAGIGSTVYQAVRLGRRGIGVELKRSYYETAARNMRRLDNELGRPSLFDAMQEVS